MSRFGTKVGENTGEVRGKMGFNRDEERGGGRTLQEERRVG